MDKHLDVPIADRTSFHVPARARAWVDAHSLEEMAEAIRWARAEGLPVYVLGEGANVLFVGDFQGMILHPCNRGIREELEGESVVLHVAAGENWDGLVQYAVDRGYWGIECLGGIPGSVGAAPVQNIGAYGAEVGDVLVSVHSIDMHSLEPQVRLRDELQLGYRDSIFKGRLRGKEVIHEVSLRLHHQRPSQEHFMRLGMTPGEAQRATPRDVYETVRSIRASKLPDPATVGSAGSFFKNPVVPLDDYMRLCEKFPNAPHYPALDGHVKLPAGWLIDQCGWKGYRQGDAGVWPQQALVLVNYGLATGKEVQALCQAICADVLAKTGIVLEPEVNIIA